jgi:hypothetical protein
MISRVQAGACLAALLLSVTLPGVAGAQLLGSMSTASVEEVGASKVGGYVGVTNDFVSLAGQYRFGVASSFDLGAKAAYVDFSSPLGNSLALNADAKIQILDIFLQDPVDLSLGPEVTYFRVNGITPVTKTTSTPGSQPEPSTASAATRPCSARSSSRMRVRAFTPAYNTSSPERIRAFTLR